MGKRGDLDSGKSENFDTEHLVSTLDDGQDGGIRDSANATWKQCNVLLWNLMDSIYAQCESGMPKTPSLLAQFKFLRRPGGLVATGQAAIDGQTRRQEQDQQHH